MTETQQPGQSEAPDPQSHAEEPPKQLVEETTEQPAEETRVATAPTTPAQHDRWIWLDRGNSFAQILATIVALAALLYLIRQVGMQRQDIDIQREQFQQQRQVDTATQRANLLATIYGRRDCETESIDDCPFAATTRVRGEAALAFVEIERERGVTPDLTSVNLISATLSTVIYTGTVISGDEVGVDLQNVILDGANLSGTYLENANLRGAYLNYAHLHYAHLTDSDLSRAELVGADLSEAFLKRTDLSEALLFGADLSGAKLWKADLSGAFLWNADLSGAILWDSDLSGANLSGADLGNALLGDASLNNAKYNDNTKWPIGFVPEVHGTLFQKAQE